MVTAEAGRSSGSYDQRIGKRLERKVFGDVQQAGRDDLKAAFREKGINVSTSSGSGIMLSYSPCGLEAGLVRASIHHFNTQGELDRFLLAICGL